MHMNTDNTPTAETQYVQVAPKVKPAYISNKKIHITPKTIALVLTCAICLLVLAHLIALYFLPEAERGEHLAAAMDKFFNLNNERNIPTFYASFQLVCCSLLSFLVYSIYKKKGVKQRHYWLTLTIIFFYLSLDEVLQIHERLNNAFQGLFPKTETQYVFWPWIIAYSCLAILIGVYFLKFLLMLKPKTRKLFILAGSIYVTGALVMEFIGNEFFEYNYNIVMWTLITLEEVFELAGIAIFIYAVFDYITPLTLEIGIEKDAPADKTHLFN